MGKVQVDQEHLRHQIVCIRARVTASARQTQINFKIITKIKCKSQLFQLFTVVLAIETAFGMYGTPHIYTYIKITDIKASGDRERERASKVKEKRHHIIAIA